MELEPSHAVFLNKSSGVRYGRRALAGVHGPERDEDVGVACGAFGDLLAGQCRVPGRRLGLDGEHHRGDVSLAVVTGDLIQGRGAWLPSFEYAADASISAWSSEKCP
jgi:hypothetical protein